MKIGEQFRLYGFRAKINFRSLLKCLAYRNGRKTVTEEDFQEFLELADYMNFNFNLVNVVKKAKKRFIDTLDDPQLFKADICFDSKRILGCYVCQLYKCTEREL